MIAQLMTVGIIMVKIFFMTIFIEYIFQICVKKKRKYNTYIDENYFHRVNYPVPVHHASTGVPVNLALKNFLF